MGPVARDMLALITASPNGEASFRPTQISRSALEKGWVKQVFESGTVRWFTMTDEGRRIYADYLARKGRSIDYRWPHLRYG